MTFALPSAVLTFLSADDRLGPAVALVVALLFPFTWSLADLLRRGRVSPLAALALVSIAMTGGVGLLELSPEWLAVKEALLPTGIGVATLLTAATRWSVIPTVLDLVLDPERVARLLAERGVTAGWSTATTWGSRWVGVLFLGSALANFTLARWLVVSPGGTPAFNEELGRYTALSFPVIVLPMTVGMGLVLRSVLSRLERLTGVELEELLRAR